MELDAAVALWAESSERVSKAVNGMVTANPIWKPLGVANTPSAATTQTLIIPQSPAAGRMWFIHRVNVLGADGHTAVAGVADVYAGPGQEADATAQLYSGLTIPSIVVEGMDTHPVMPNERVYAIFYNLAAQQQLQFAVAVEEYPYDARLASSASG